jgi:hypothetical protein
LPRDTADRPVTEIADLVLAHLIQNPEQLSDFMTITGISPGRLRQEVGTPGFALGLLDYVVQNEGLLVAVCEADGLKPEAVMRVWGRYNSAD